jgi:hypothetical protein
MKNKEEKAQETIIKRVYEKPVLIVISTTSSDGKTLTITGEGVTNGFNFAPS